MRAKLKLNTMETRKNLTRSSLSYWENATFGYIDFLIIGAGLYGMWLAYFLSKKYPRASVAILERGTRCLGASSANAGFVCLTGSLTEMMSSIKIFGHAEMLNMISERCRGTHLMLDILGGDAIGYERVGGYECFSRKIHSLEFIKHQIETTNQFLFKNLKESRVIETKNTFKWSQGGLEKFGLRGFDGMAVNESEGVLRSNMLLAALEQKIHDLRVKIFDGMNVTGYDEDRSKVVVEVENEFLEIPCGNLFLCVNGSIIELNNDVKITPARGQILVTSPIENFKLKGSFHFNEGFTYFREIDGRLMIGGQRNEFLKKEETLSQNPEPAVIDSILDFAIEHILGEEVDCKVEFKSAGTMAFTEKKLPVFHHSNGGRVHTIVGCNGMGVTLAPALTQKFVQCSKF